MRVFTRMKLYILLAVTVAFLAHSKARDTFGAVTSIHGLEGLLYLRLRIREPHLDPDRSTDAETKKRICESITRSGFFASRGKYPLDMNEIHRSMELDVSQPETLEMGTPTAYYERLLEDYEKKRFRRARYTYRSRLVTFSVLGSTKEKEFAFACAVRDDRESTSATALYSISDAYDVNSALDVPADRRIEVRFVCQVLWNSVCDIVAVAEEPASAYSHEEFSVEDVYLRVRQSYLPAEKDFEDPVCGLSKSEKLRVCASVMTSSDFTRRVRFSATWSNFEEECQMTSVSLRGDHVDIQHQEWMLSCPVERTGPNAGSAYSVSRAYRSHYAVVYVYRDDTKKWYIENISADVSVIIDSDRTLSEEGKKLRQPNLADLLNNARKWKSGRRGLSSSLFATEELNMI